MAKRLTHLSNKGEAHMVDVGEKPATMREAIAEGDLLLAPGTRRVLFAGDLPKGDALAVARIAGIQAAKRTSDIIPLCHPLPTTSIDIDISEVRRPSAVRVRATVRVVARTGVEMEALTAVSAALLTLYDMLKAIQKDMVISNVRLRRKTGGRSGDLDLP